MRTEITTARGYNLFDVASCLQKSIRRADAKLAGYMAHELFASGYDNYCWKRLLTIGAEDVEQFIQKELVALHYSYELINKGKKAGEKKGRIFLSKAVIMLCKAIKSRETDHLQNLVYDKKLGITDKEIEDALCEWDAGVVADIPDYVFDVHTLKGKKMGRTKKDFFLKEQEALLPFGDDMFLDELKQYINEIE